MSTKVTQSAKQGALAGIRSRNGLLSSLSGKDYAIIAKQLKPVGLSSGQILCEPLEANCNFYFPETAVCSLVTVMRNGRTVEAATVGFEGAVGLSPVFGKGAMTTRCLVQIAGNAQTLTTHAALRAIGEMPAFGEVLRRYTQVFLNQITQTVACNTLHSVDQRCALWLLMTHDRVGDVTTFELTQEFLSYMLGVRREAVSGASSALQQAGIISYKRGRMSILDRTRLEVASCECYGANRANLRRLFPQ